MVQIDFYRVEILNFRFLTLIIHFTLFLHYGMDKGFSYVNGNETASNTPINTNLSLNYEKKSKTVAMRRVEILTLGKLNGIKISS